MTKELRKAIMKRSKLRNKFLKGRNEESKRRFNCQRTSVIACSAKLKSVFLGNQTTELSLTIEDFGKLSVLSSRKRLHKESIILSNNNTTISNDEELAEIFNKHFSELVENLDTDENLAGSIASLDITDPAFNVIKKYEYHPTLKKIKYFVSGKDLQFCLNKK